MPGKPVCRTNPLVYRALKAQKLSVRGANSLNSRVFQLLKFVQHQAKLNPEIVWGDGEERTTPADSPEAHKARELCRKIAADAIVLLKNEDGVLPIKKEKYKKVAIVGPNAKERVISGGGSAALKPSYVVTPYEGISKALEKEGIEVGYEVGCYGEWALLSVM